jgi:hypothetical protein
MSSSQGHIVVGRMYEDGPFYPRQYVPPGAQPQVDPPCTCTDDGRITAGCRLHDPVLTVRRT